MIRNSMKYLPWMEYEVNSAVFVTYPARW